MKDTLSFYLVKIRGNTYRTIAMEVCFRKCLFPLELKNEQNANVTLFCLGVVLQILSILPIFSLVNTDCRWLEMGVLFNQSSNSGYCHTFWTFHRKPCAMSIVYMCTRLQRPELFDCCLRPGVLGSKTQEKDRTGTPESFSLSVWGGVLVGIFLCWFFFSPF